MKKKFLFLGLIVLLFSGCTEDKIFFSSSVKNFSVPIVSVTTIEQGQKKKYGYGVICSDTGYYPLHLNGDTTFITQDEENFFIEPQKIFSAMDVVEFPIGEEIKNNIKGDTLPFISSVQDENFFSEIELNDTKLVGNFFSIPSTKNFSFTKGDSGMGVFDANGECRGMLIGVLQHSGEGIFVALPIEKTIE